MLRHAAAVYLVLRLLLDRPAAVASMLVMVAIELFQLTLIPASLAASENTFLWTVGRLLGTHFGYLDLAAYAAGIACIRAADRYFFE